MPNLHDSLDIYSHGLYIKLNTGGWSFDVHHIYLFFSWHVLQWENFVMTSKTFPVGSKHASTIPVLDDQSRIFQDPSKLALTSTLWLLSSFSVIFSFPVLHRYNFTLCASNFTCTSIIFAPHSEIASVWPLQLWALIGLSMFKILATFLGPVCPFLIDRNANTAARFISK